MNKKNPFADRVLTQAFTPEFMREFAGLEGNDAHAALERAVVWFEQSYNAVAAVGPGWTVYAIPATNADPDEINRGLQSMHYWISDNGGGR